MNRYIVLRDRRLEGGVRAAPRTDIVNTDAATPLAVVFQRINALARHSRHKIHTLFIMCHGFAGSNRRLQVSMDAGGQGLQLGAEGVRHRNVAMWTAIRDQVENIAIYACAASNTERGNELTTSDGRYLMGALAIHTNATVYAADRIQWYTTYQGLSNGTYDFGIWEGQLWRFPPDGGTPTKAFNAPVEFSAVMSGFAP